MINGQREVFPFEERYTVENVAEKLGVSVEKVEKRLNNYHRTNLRHTRQYVLKTFLEKGIKRGIGHPWGFLVKEDFIEEYYRTRLENNLEIFDIDFSYLPDIIPTSTTKVTILINELSQKGVPIGKVEVIYKRFIAKHHDDKHLGEIIRFRKKQKEKELKFINESKAKFPGKFLYDKVDFQGMDRPVTLTCLTCGKDFQQTPHSHLHSCGACPKCAVTIAHERFVTTEEKFFSTVEKKYGDILDFSDTVFNGLYDSEGNTNSVEVKVISTGKIKRYKAAVLLFGNVNPINISKGEQVVESALRKLNIEYKTQKYFKVNNNSFPELINIRERIFVDFYFKYDNKEYIIEYNGEQHYRWQGIKFRQESVDIYNNRIKRDKSVKEYCLNNNIVFIEIPYTVDLMSDSIYLSLRKIIIDGNEPSNVFPTLIPEIYE
jgi:hypothetical protein